MVEKKTKMFYINFTWIPCVFSFRVIIDYEELKPRGVICRDALTTKTQKWFDSLVIYIKSSWETRIMLNNVYWKANRADGWYLALILYRLPVKLPWLAKTKKSSGIAKHSWKKDLLRRFSWKYMAKMIIIS